MWTSHQVLGSTEHGNHISPALIQGKIIYAASMNMIALDAATGKLLWKTVIGAPRLGESAAGAPLAWGGIVYMGIGGSELGEFLCLSEPDLLNRVSIS